MAAPDTVLYGVGLNGISADSILITPNGGSQTTLAAALAPSVAPALRFMPLTDAKTDAGLPLPASPTTTTPTVTRVVGSSMVLTGVSATSGTISTTKAVWELDMPLTYQGGSAVPFVVNVEAAGSGTLVASGTSVTMAAYSEAAGVEAALTVTSGAQAVTSTAANYSASIAGSGLVPGSHIVLEVAVTADVSSGVNTPTINSVAISA